MSVTEPRVAGLTLKSGNPLTATVDAVIIATTTDSKFSIFSDGLTKAAATKLISALQSVGATGAKDELIRIPATGIASSKVIVAVGLGSTKDGITEEQLRRAAGAATRSLPGFKKVALHLPATYAAAAGAILEGAALGAYSFTDHKYSTLNKSKSPVASITLFTEFASDSKYRKALDRARILAHSIHFARDLINTSPLHLPPAQVAVAAKNLLTQTSIKVQVLDEKALATGGYGGILGVGKGSSRPPRLIRMEYKPRGAKKHIALLGKGITFDTGGISLKPPLDMHEMKADMSGAAAVIAAIKIIHDLNLPISVTAYAACAENMPGGNAQRPGDVITTYGGRTIEVLNTDAEGRLVLADVIVRAAEDKPDVILDIATLTGTAVVALGQRTAAVMGDDFIRDAVKAAADRAGESFWPMPMAEELRASLDSLVADIANMGQLKGGLMTAAWFLKEFVPEGIPWAHLDIAGPAYNSQPAHGYTHKGGVGFGVRTMVAFAEDVISGVV